MFSSGSLTVRRASRIASWSGIGDTPENRGRVGVRGTAPGRVGPSPGPAHGIARPSIVQRNIDFVAAQLDAMRLHRFERGQAEGLARPDVEPRPVTRTPDLDALELPLRQRPAIMRADIIDGIEGSIHV